MERTIPCLVVPETFPYETLKGRKALEDEWMVTIDFNRGTIRSAAGNTVKKIRKPADGGTRYDLEGNTVYNARVVQRKHRCRDILQQEVAKALAIPMPQSRGRICLRSTLPLRDLLRVLLLD